MAVLPLFVFPEHVIGMSTKYAIAFSVQVEFFFCGRIQASNVDIRTNVPFVAASEPNSDCCSVMMSPLWHLVLFCRSLPNGIHVLLSKHSMFIGRICEICLLTFSSITPHLNMAFRQSTLMPSNFFKSFLCERTVRNKFSKNNFNWIWQA